MGSAACRAVFVACGLAIGCGASNGPTPTPPAGQDPAPADQPPPSATSGAQPADATAPVVPGDAPRGDAGRAPAPDATAMEALPPIVPPTTLPAAARAGLVMWLDAGRDVVTTAGAVSLWRDLSGRQNDAAQANARYRPTVVPDAANGKPAVRFAKGTFLAVPRRDDIDFGTGDFAFLFVMRYRNEFSGAIDEAGKWDGVGVVFTKPTGTAVGFHLSGGWPKLKRRYHLQAGAEADPGAESAATLVVNDDVLRVVGARRVVSDTGRVLDVRLDGAVSGSSRNKTVADVSGAADMYIGTNRNTVGRPLDGDIAEVLVWKGKLDDAALAAVEAYLKAKYAIR